MTPAGLIYCSWCGAATPMDYVHGHAQCVRCKTNIVPCCDGAGDCDSPDGATPPASQEEPGRWR